ncbi:hypothetical protein KEF85_09385 [Methylomonas paludis]|uniref:Uncharacterized protein n=1 Tax=Methylomonas paludis TaxID=1173101 RepID=A0A975MKL3_9GAMM|nr:hypothetical protein [Methylomonas paludis]QWF69593.1 hypothetical protein KEF85_09385 [Methylomonas paludis]
MKTPINWKRIILISTLIFSSTAWAVTPDEEDEKVCKKPKFRDANPGHLAEVAPESQISFHASRGTDPGSVTAEAKGEKLTVTVTNKVTFLLVNAKLPATLRDGFARVHVTAKAADGGCLGQDGWLLKIKDPAQLAEAK